MRLKLSILLSVLIINATSFEQTISPKFLEEVASFLAADSLKGRANFSKELQIAGNYIAKHFEKIGLGKAALFYLQLY